MQVQVCRDLEYMATPVGHKMGLVWFRCPFIATIFALSVSETQIAIIVAGTSLDFEITAWPRTTSVAETSKRSQINLTSDHIRMAQDAEPRYLIVCHRSRPHDGTSQEEALTFPCHCRMERPARHWPAFCPKLCKSAVIPSTKVTKGGRPNSTHTAILSRHYIQ